MQALIDYAGSRKWKDYSKAEETQTSKKGWGSKTKAKKPRVAS